jgi:NTP pyrophosphatase (non-canonical NTP hydrolase)
MTINDGYLDEICQVVHDTAVEKGFWGDNVTLDVIGYKLALVHSEVTEILEAIRKTKGDDKIAEEFADAIIRLCDLYKAMYDSGKFALPSLDKAVYAKAAINETRPRLHGWGWG